MAVVQDIFEYINSFAPVETKAQWDNCGILVGDREQFVRRALVSLDITNEVVAEAKKISAQLIISHHPVIFNPVSSVTSESVVYELISNNISAVCMHTNLDLAEDCGVNICLANSLLLDNIALLDGEFIAKGDTKEEYYPVDFAYFVKRKLNCNGLRYTEPYPNKTIKKVAVSSGSGGESFLKAAELGCDALVTGEIKHHEILQANAHGICIFDVGHFKSEDVVVGALCEKLNAHFNLKNVSFLKSQTFSDKIKYCAE